jgi:hypothetical protein
MIVRIDKSGEDQEPVQVDIRGPRLLAGMSGRTVEDTGYAIACDLDRRTQSVPRSHGTPGSANDLRTFIERITILDPHWKSLAARKLYSWLK